MRPVCIKLAWKINLATPNFKRLPTCLAHLNPQLLQRSRLPLGPLLHSGVFLELQVAQAFSNGPFFLFRFFRRLSKPCNSSASNRLRLSSWRNSNCQFELLVPSSSSNILSSDRSVFSWSPSGGPDSMEESRLCEDRVVEETSLCCSIVLEDPPEPEVAGVANPAERSPSEERTAGVLEGKKFDREDFRRRVCATKKEGFDPGFESPGYNLVWACNTWPLLWRNSCLKVACRPVRVTSSALPSSPLDSSLMNSWIFFPNNSPGCLSRRARTLDETKRNIPDIDIFDHRSFSPIPPVSRIAVLPRA